VSAPLDDEALRALPTVDLHLHLVGAASPATVLDLAARYPDGGVPTDLHALEQFFTFRDFAHFLTVYDTVSSLVRTPDDITLLVAGLARDLAAQGVPYAEVTVTPVTHERAGIAPQDLAAALARGAHDARDIVTLAWVYDISGFDGAPGGWATLDSALRYPPPDLVGFGLGGPERGVPRARFTQQFAAARAAGLHCVPHAGETTGPQEVWSAVRDLRAERVGHGIAAAQDAVLCRHLAENDVTLEVCPSSNLATAAVRSWAHHPLPALLALGVPVTLGSDDPPMFGTSLLEEYRRARDILGLPTAVLLHLVESGIRASFAPPALRARLLADLRRWQRAESTPGD
jgi:aminodeoxyfutalosine deaminase